MVGKRQGKRKHPEAVKHNPKRKNSRADKTCDSERADENNGTALDETQPPTDDVDLETQSSQREAAVNLLNGSCEFRDGDAEKDLCGSTEGDEQSMSYDIILQNDANTVLQEDSNSMSILDSKPDQNVTADLICKPVSVLLENCKFDKMSNISCHDQMAESSDVKEEKMNPEKKDNFKNNNNSSNEPKLCPGTNKIDAHSKNKNNPAALFSQSSLDDCKSIFCSQSVRKKFQPPLKKEDSESRVDVTLVKNDAASNCYSSNGSTTSLFISHRTEPDTKSMKSIETTQELCETKETSGEQNDCKMASASDTTLLPSVVIEKGPENTFQAQCGDTSSRNETKLESPSVIEEVKENLFDGKEQRPSKEIIVQDEKTNLSQQNQLGCFSYTNMNKEEEFSDKAKAYLFTGNQPNLCTDFSMDMMSNAICQKQNKAAHPATLSQSPAKTLVLSQDSQHEDSISQDTEDFNGCTQKFDTSFIVNKVPSQTNPNIFADLKEQKQTKEAGDSDEASLNFINTFDDLKDITAGHKQCENELDTKLEVKGLTQRKNSEPADSEPKEKSPESSLIKDGDKMEYSKVFDITNYNSTLDNKAAQVCENPPLDVPKSNKDEISIQKNVPDHSTCFKEDKNLDSLIPDKTKCLADNASYQSLCIRTDGFQKNSKSKMDATEEKLPFDIFHTPEKKTANCFAFESFRKNTNGDNEDYHDMSTISKTSFEQPELEKATDCQLSKTILNVNHQGTSGCVPKANIDIKDKEQSNCTASFLPSIHDNRQDNQGQGCSTKGKELSNYAASSQPVIPVDCQDIPEYSSSRQLTGSPWDGDGVSDAMMMMLTDSQLCGTSIKKQDLGKVLAEKRMDAVKHVANKRDEGRALTQIVLNELVSVNKQLLRLKREMDSFKRNMSSSGGTAGPRHSTSLPLRHQSKLQQAPNKFKQ